MVNSMQCPPPYPGKSAKIIQNLLDIEVWLKRQTSNPKMDHTDRWSLILEGAPFWYTKLAQPYSSTPTVPAQLLFALARGLQDSHYFTIGHLSDHQLKEHDTHAEDISSNAHPRVRVWRQCVYIGFKTNPPTHPSLKDNFCNPSPTINDLPSHFPRTQNLLLDTTILSPRSLVEYIPQCHCNHSRWIESLLPNRNRWERHVALHNPYLPQNLEQNCSVTIYQPSCTNQPRWRPTKDVSKDWHNGFNVQSSHFHENQNFWHDWKWLKPATMMFSSLISQCITFSRGPVLGRSGLDLDILWEVATHHWWCWGSWD